MTAEPPLDAATGPFVATAPATATIEGLTFDDAFAALRSVVAELEAGGLALEETIARTERAVALQRHCEQLLGAAELRVRQLISRPGGGLEAPDIAADEAVDG
ncbi:MAG TPA: exodeoxyribonuclease VII small subunit [Patescibacteria group bacterium]|nr:exodeoxyribonuclease VII small subunit [Patescibacteria group bacterium]